MCSDTPRLVARHRAACTGQARRMRLFVAAALGIATGVALSAPPTPVHEVPVGFTFAAGGDMIGPNQRLALGSPQDAGLERVANLFRAADFGFANQEGSLFNLSTFRGWPAAETGGGYPLAPAGVARDYRAMGINVVSKANNHATDFGTEGLVASMSSLSAAGVAYVGAGMDLSQARAPVYVTTHKGVAGFVDVASTFTPMSVAGGPDAHRFGQYAHGRPGISALHVAPIHVIPCNRVRALRELTQGVSQLGGGSAWSGEVPDTGAAQDGRPTQFSVGDLTFRCGSPAATTWEMDPSDLNSILQSVRDAARKASFVLFSMHAHEITPCGATPGCDNLTSARPADFERKLAHFAIDNGADAVVRTGPHVLGGIEIYKGKPIFYSLGSLFFQFDGLKSYKVPGGPLITFTAPWFQTVVPVVTYRGHDRGILITLHPVEIVSEKGQTNGFPQIAGRKAALQILNRVKDLSKQYGTAISVTGSVGIVSVK